MNVLLKNILCLVGTRPECIKMAPVIQAFRRSGWADVTVVSTGQHRDLVSQIFALFDIIVDFDLDVMKPDQSLCGLSSKIFSKIEPVINETKPDLILVQGDTTSVMIAALAGFYLRVPIGHVEAGLRTHKINTPFPEEMNRVVTSIVTALHFAPTQAAHDNLLAENKEPASIHITGNTVIDALLDISERDYTCPYPVNPDRKLILLTAHRRESFGKPIRQICAAIRDLHTMRPELEFVYPAHPNPNVQKPVYELLEGLERVHLIPPANYPDLIALMKNAYLILTDSGGIQEEAPALAKPVLILRDETERPEAVEAGVAHLVGPHHEKIIAWVNQLLDDETLYDKMSCGASPYGDGMAAKRIVSICQSFLDAKRD